MTAEPVRCSGIDRDQGSAAAGDLADAGHVGRLGGAVRHVSGQLLGD